MTICDFPGIDRVIETNKNWAILLNHYNLVPKTANIWILLGATVHEEADSTVGEKSYDPRRMIHEEGAWYLVLDDEDNDNKTLKIKIAQKPYKALQLSSRHG